MAIFNKTDVVKLKSGGPDMNIKDMWTDKAGETFLQCSWLNEAKELVESTFRETSLELVKAETAVKSEIKKIESAVVSEVKSIAVKVQSVFEKKQVTQPAASVVSTPPAPTTSAPTVAPVVTPVDVSKK